MEPLFSSENPQVGEGEMQGSKGGYVGPCRLKNLQSQESSATLDHIGKSIATVERGRDAECKHFRGGL